MKKATVEKILNNYQTPLYVFDINTLAERARYLRSRLPEGVSLCYAIKQTLLLPRALPLYRKA